MRFKPSAVVETALIAVGVVLLAFGQEQQLGGDGLARWEAVRLLFEHGRVSDTIYSLIGPVFSFPLWAIGTLVGALDPVLRYYNVALFALSLVALYFLMRKWVEGELLRRFLLLVVAGSMIAPHVHNFYGEVFTLVAVGVGLVAVVGGLRKSGWVAVVLGAATTPASLVGLGLVSVGESLRFKRFRYLVPVMAGAVLVLAEIGLRRGFDAEYSNDVAIAKTVMPYSGLGGFSYPFFFGLLAILFSFGKGLVFYLPGLLLPVWRSLTGQLQRLYLLWILFLAGLVLAYAPWWSWYGGDYWGPRFFVAGILPASLALAVALTFQRGLLYNFATLAVLVLSIWIGADSLVLGSYFPPECFIGYYQYAYVCHFTLEFSQLWYPMVRPPALTGGQIVEFGYYAVVFVWLAVPLMLHLVDQLSDRFARVSFKQWRF
jgi:hypothetical protein